jgi:hypothetical protein
MWGLDSSLAIRTIARLILISAPLLASGAWRPEALQYASQRYANSPIDPSLSEEERGMVATLWGGGLRVLNPGPEVRALERLVWDPTRFEKPLKVVAKTHLIKTTNRYRVKAPLMVFVPGIFSDSGDISGRMTVKWFSELGYHVLVVPNPLGADFLRAHPKRTAAFPQFEASLIRYLVERAVIEWFGEEYVSTIHISGESLGALIAAATFAEGFKDTKFSFSDLTLFWPPLSLNQAIHNLDYWISKTGPNYRDHCAPLIENFGFQLRVFFGDFLRSPKPIEKECAPALVTQHGFKANLINTANIMRVESGVPPLNDDASDRLTFADFIGEFMSESAMMEQRAELMLGHWLKLAPNPNWKLLTSEDDFLNLGMEEQSFLKDSKRVIRAPWGGHTALTADSGYSTFIRMEFKRPVRGP